MFTKKLLSLILTLSLVLSLSVPTFAAEKDSTVYFENTLGSYTTIEEVETPYGTAYYVKKHGNIQTRSIWDVVDILMAGASWANLFANPSWGNFGWAVLDTAALLPVLPASAYFRKGGKTFLKIDEVAKFAKTSKGKKAVSAAMKTYKYSDGISSKAIKEISKKFKGTEGKKVLKLFKDAADKGLVGATSQSGIKKYLLVQKSENNTRTKLK
ncbi:hypothetical protein [Acetivibrio ethanolgignens]|uniref:Uncharacterized protein n=1 Tax=Acetivibrio ethanolgignens TaxID=290052 RepID=A0A0V8QAW0_9FIRM|nr:hypothetical protein [Acetivibrio ethanolgignens]KSV57697.1 hypothetical protein ASU35_15525 [Acetivibrio ethanolgignens]